VSPSDDGQSRQFIISITIRTERVVGAKVDFNEVLSVLYREGQKMSWHDDGEPGKLNPRELGLAE
jgi:alkylated DNA repair dioxygenase AlkB